MIYTTLCCSLQYLLLYWFHLSRVCAVLLPLLLILLSFRLVSRSYYISSLSCPVFHVFFLLLHSILLFLTLLFCSVLFCSVHTFIFTFSFSLTQFHSSRLVDLIDWRLSSTGETETSNTLNKMTIQQQKMNSTTIQY